MLGYESVMYEMWFFKKCVWEEVPTQICNSIVSYCIEADKGFVIEGDFDYFKRIIDNMQMNNFHVPFKIESLQVQSRMCMQKILKIGQTIILVEINWQSMKILIICADAFAKIVENNIHKV